MSIYPKSAHQIMQTLNEKLDSSHCAFDDKMETVVKEALGELSNMRLNSRTDRVELLALASRISILAKTKDLSNPLDDRVSHQFDFLRGKLEWM